MLFLGSSKYIQGGPKITSKFQTTGISKDFSPFLYGVFLTPLTVEGGLEKFHMSPKAEIYVTELSEDVRQNFLSDVIVTSFFNDDVIKIEHCI